MLSKLISRIKRLLPARFGYSKLYRDIGQQAAIDKLVDDFYIIMQTDPKAKDCLATHAGRDISESAMKLKYFLSGWLGGPPLYMEKFGHPRLRMRHFSFAIGSKESDQWIYCMNKALEQSKISKANQMQMIEAFVGLTKLIKNRD
jgi:hemoglobin